MPDSDSSTVDRHIDLAARVYARELESELKAHPEAEELVAFHEGLVESARAETIRRHVVACQQCAEELGHLNAFDLDEGAGEEDSAAVEAAARSWERFREHPDDRPRRPLLWSGGRRVFSAGTRSSGWTLAASVVFALIGAVSLYLADRAAYPHDATSLDGESPFVFDLLPSEESGRRDLTTSESVEVPPEMNLLVPRLLLGDQTPYARYSALLTGPSGEIVWRQTGLRRQPSGAFVLIIPRAQVPPGEYVLRLLADEDAGAAVELASYPFRLSEAE